MYRKTASITRYSCWRYEGWTVGVKGVGLLTLRGYDYWRYEGMTIGVTRVGQLALRG